MASIKPPILKFFLIFSIFFHKNHPITAFYPQKKDDLSPSRPFAYNIKKKDFLPESSSSSTFQPPLPSLMIPNSHSFAVSYNSSPS